jgi:SAM-dependent methyltransferase
MTGSPGTFGKDYFDRAYGGGWEKRNPARKLEYYLGQVRESKPSGRLLDVGCAYGDFLARARRYYEVSGCDVSEHAVRTARERFPGLPVFRAAIGELPPGERYDVITCFDLLEHVADLAGAFDALSRRLERGGVLALTVPVYDGPAGRLTALLDRDDTHLWKRTRQFWREELRSHGFVIVRDVGLWRYLILDRVYIFFGGAAWRNLSPALLLVGARP